MLYHYCIWAKVTYSQFFAEIDTETETVIYNNVTMSCRGKKRLEKSLEAAKNDITDLSEKLLKLQTGTYRHIVAFFWSSAAPTGWQI